MSDSIHTDHFNKRVILQKPYFRDFLGFVEFRFLVFCFLRINDIILLFQMKKNNFLVRILRLFQPQQPHEKKAMREKDSFVYTKFVICLIL